MSCQGLAEFAGRTPARSCPSCSSVGLVVVVTGPLKFPVWHIVFVAEIGKVLQQCVEVLGRRKGGRCSFGLNTVCLVGACLPSLWPTVSLPLGVLGEKWQAYGLCGAQHLL